MAILNTYTFYTEDGLRFTAQGPTHYQALIDTGRCREAPLRIQTYHEGDMDLYLYDEQCKKWHRRTLSNHTIEEVQQLLHDITERVDTMSSISEFLPGMYRLMSNMVELHRRTSGLDRSHTEDYLLHHLYNTLLNFKESL